MYQWEKGISLSFFQNEQGECVGGDKVVQRAVYRRT